MNKNVIIMETRGKETRVKGVLAMLEETQRIILGKYLLDRNYTDINPVNEATANNISVFAKESTAYGIAVDFSIVSKEVNSIVLNMKKAHESSSIKTSIFSLEWNEPRHAPTKDLIFIFDCINKGVKPIFGRW